MCHVKTNEHGYQILEGLLQKCQPKIITIEYGRDFNKFDCASPVIRPGELNARAMDEIEEQVRRVREIIRQSKLS